MQKSILVLYLTTFVPQHLLFSLSWIISHIEMVGWYRFLRISDYYTYIIILYDLYLGNCFLFESFISDISDLLDIGCFLYTDDLILFRDNLTWFCWTRLALTFTNISGHIVCCCEYLLQEEETYLNSLS